MTDGGRDATEAAAEGETIRGRTREGGEMRTRGGTLISKKRAAAMPTMKYV